jgi:ferrous iron transport protein B
MFNRAFRLMGLNGKAVLPMVLGLGCDTMATLSTRILETRRDRILTTLLLAVGVPCSAQSGVILGMLAGNPAGLAVWAAVIFGVLLLVGKTAARLLPGEESPFLYELPPLRRPKLSNVLIKTVNRIEWYLREAVPLFFLGTLALFLANSVGLLSWLEQIARPLITGWLGLPAKATEALLIGFLRRDFGAAGLFVPCIAQYFMMLKEQGWKIAAAIAGLAFTLAFVVGGLVMRALTLWGGMG